MIHIRQAQPDDAETIIAFQHLMAMETEGLRLNEASISAGVRAVFDDPAKGQYLVAEVDGAVAGLLLTQPEWSDWRNGTLIWIQSLFVHPDYRRRGVYRAMYDHLRQQVEADDSLRGIRLYVDAGNAQAMKAYESLGMDGEHYRVFEWIK
jgi:GNAT superfamily N-acetyltransferase